MQGDIASILYHTFLSGKSFFVTPALPKRHRDNVACSAGVTDVHLFDCLLYRSHQHLSIRIFPRLGVGSAYEQHCRQQKQTGSCDGRDH